MYSIVKTQSPLYPNISIFRIHFERRPLSSADFYHELASGNDMLIDSFSEVIKEFPAAAIFFETPPITFESYRSTAFEFVLLPSSSLEQVTPNFRPFEEKFASKCVENASKVVVSFNNLGGDCTLVSPCPVPLEPSAVAMPDAVIDFAHLSRFVRNAQQSTIRRLWQRVGEEVLHRMERSPGELVWVSTSGLGVFWLHVRIDSVPKYYNFEPYKLAQVP